jgi:hypothetical protein
LVDFSPRFSANSNEAKIPCAICEQNIIFKPHFVDSIMPKVHLLDYAAGNIRSLVNAIEKLGWEVEWIQSPADVSKADVSQRSHSHDTFNADR